MPLINAKTESICARALSTESTLSQPIAPHSHSTLMFVLATPSICSNKRSSGLMTAYSLVLFVVPRMRLSTSTSIALIGMSDRGRRRTRGRLSKVLIDMPPHYSVLAASWPISNIFATSRLRIRQHMKSAIAPLQKHNHAKSLASIQSSGRFPVSVQFSQVGRPTVIPGTTRR